MTEWCEGCGRPVPGPEMYALCGRCAAVVLFKWAVGIFAIAAIAGGASILLGR